MPRLPRVSAPELVRALEKEGYVLSRSKGSHRIYHHPETGKRVTVPYHAGRTIPPGTVANHPAGS
jgi:predicted RNA binding protein YcfA (HicA-like mRNA interferase family)